MLLFSPLISTSVSGALIFFREDATTGRNVTIYAITVKITVKKNPSESITGVGLSRQTPDSLLPSVTCS